MMVIQNYKMTTSEWLYYFPNLSLLDYNGFSFLLFSPSVFSQGEEGTSWYIILKGSVNVVIYGKVGISITLFNSKILTTLCTPDSDVFGEELIGLLCFTGCCLYSS